MPPEAYPMHDEYNQARLHHLHTMSSETLNSYSDLDDPNRGAMPPHGGARNKRRPVPGADHIKHRRTRSGCYTCRQRRVKVCSSYTDAVFVVLTSPVYSAMKAIPFARVSIVQARGCCRMLTSFKDVGKESVSVCIPNCPHPRLPPKDEALPKAKAPARKDLARPGRTTTQSRKSSTPSRTKKMRKALILLFQAQHCPVRHPFGPRMTSESFRMHPRHHEI